MYAHKDGIVLRKVEANDLPDLLALKRESWWGTHKTPIINLKDQQRWYEFIPIDQLYMIGELCAQPGAVLKKDRSFLSEIDKLHPVGVVAYTGIDWISRTLSISGSVYHECRRTDIVRAGFAAGLDFAFEMLNMERVEAEVLEYNIPAQRLEIDFLGFKIEGRRRRAVYKCGHYYDSLVLGLLRQEWLKSPRIEAYGDSCNSNFSPHKMDKLAARFSRAPEGASTAR